MRDNPEGVFDDYNELVRTVVEDEDKKTLFYGVYDPFSQNPYEQQLTGLKVVESFPLFEGIGLQKNSEFTELFNYHIFKLYESGVIKR